MGHSSLQHPHLQSEHISEVFIAASSSESMFSNLAEHAGFIIPEPQLAASIWQMYPLDLP
jgi:hypothetical protein